MQNPPRHRLATHAALRAGETVMLQDNPAHYLMHVLRLGVGAAVALFNRTDGEWRAEIAEVKKKSVTLQVHAQTRPPERGPDLWVAFAPIKGGRLETIIEKATELGAAELHPLLTQRTIVDKVNPERAENIAREAAEQCERTSWPHIHAPRKLAQWLGDFPTDRVLIYGDETGGGITVNEALNRVAPQLREPLAAGVSPQGEGGASPPSSTKWAILAGPEGGFTPEELALLRRLPQARAVSLGPRILRADTAIITLTAITLSAWGDWHLHPRMQGAPA